ERIDDALGAAAVDAPRVVARELADRVYLVDAFDRPEVVLLARARMRVLAHLAVVGGELGLKTRDGRRSAILGERRQTSRHDGVRFAHVDVTRRLVALPYLARPD